MEFLQTRPENSVGPEVLHELIIHSWPVIAGAALLLLIQINQQLEKLRLVAHYTPAPAATSALPVKKKKKKAEDAVNADEEPAAPNLAELARPAAAPVTPMYPNSPIPGGGRVPQSAPTSSIPAAVPATQVTSTKRAPRKGEATGLSYFKVD
jgi:hypothetical protein